MKSQSFVVLKPVELESSTKHVEMFQEIMTEEKEIDLHEVNNVEPEANPVVAEEKREVR